MATQQQDIEQKEQLDRQRFVEMLRGWVDALERNEDYNVNVAGNPYVIPANAVDIGRCRVEYEVDQGEYEFELTVKWR